MKTYYCENCKSDVNIEEKLELETLIVVGEEITAEVTKKRCCVCNNELNDTLLAETNFSIIRAEYIRKI